MTSASALSAATTIGDPRQDPACWQMTADNQVIVRRRFVNEQVAWARGAGADTKRRDSEGCVPEAVADGFVSQM